MALSAACSLVTVGAAQVTNNQALEHLFLIPPFKCFEAANTSGEQASAQRRQTDRLRIRT
jgi:hypothetical protein